MMLLQRTWPVRLSRTTWARMVKRVGERQRRGHSGRSDPLRWRSDEQERCRIVEPPATKTCDGAIMTKVQVQLMH
jgi:hypothetical protein